MPLVTASTEPPMPSLEQTGSTVQVPALLNVMEIH